LAAFGQEDRQYLESEMSPGVVVLPDGPLESIEELAN
jgi:hypothetical protein